MTIFDSDYSFEIIDGKRVPALEIVGKGKPLTVTELRDFLDDLIEEGIVALTENGMYLLKA